MIPPLARRRLRSALFALLVACLAACGSTSHRSGSGRTPVPERFEGLLQRKDLQVRGRFGDSAVCAPGWKRDPGDPFFINDYTEETTVGWRNARLHFYAYAPPSAADRSVPDGSVKPRIGAWRHDGWWVEPRWEELHILRTDLAFGRAPGAETFTRLHLTPGGVDGQEPTDIRAFLDARFGDKPAPSRDKIVARLSDGAPARLGILDKDYRVVARIEGADPKVEAYVEAVGYIVRIANGEKYWYRIFDDAGQPRTELFPKLYWYSPPALADQADRRMSYPKKYLKPVDTPEDVLAKVRAWSKSTPGLPIVNGQPLLTPPEDFLGAWALGSRTWAVFWRTEQGPRLAFSDEGDPDVADILASRDRARWVDWRVAWYQLAPHRSKDWTLEVAEQTAEGERWYAFADANCERATPIGLEPRGSVEEVEGSLFRLQSLALADQARIDEQRRIEAERLAALQAERRRKQEEVAAARRAEEEERRRNTVYYTDCPKCGGKGYLVSEREIATSYSPLNGVRTTITSTQLHYDGICDRCKGAGTIDLP